MVGRAVLGEPNFFSFFLSRGVDGGGRMWHNVGRSVAKVSLGPENVKRKTKMAVEEKERGTIVGGLVDTFYHTLDEKKRLTIPSEWRDAMGVVSDDKDAPAYVYVFPNETEDCLDLVPVREMRKIIEDLSRTDILENDPVATALAQSAQMLKIDSAGRIRINDDLLAFAGIKSDRGEEVTLIGAFNKGHIWSGRKRPKGAKLNVSAFREALAKRKAARAAAKGESAT